MDTHPFRGAIVLADKLLAGLKRVLPAIDPKPSHPILASILIRAIPGCGLQLSAFDLKTGIQTIVAADVEDCWDTVISGKLFHDLLSRFPLDEIIHLGKAGTDLELLLGNPDRPSSRYTLRGLSAAQCPLLPELGQGIRVELATADLIKIARSLLPAVKTNCFTDDPLANIFVRFGDSEIQFYASDGHRIATQTISTPELQASGQAVLSTEFLKTIRQYKDLPSIVLGLADRYAYLEAGDTRIVSRTIEGEFPVQECDRYLNRKLPWTAAVPVKPLKWAVERLTKLVAKGCPIQLRADLKDQVLIVSCGDSQEFVPAQVQHGGRSRLNPLYLLHALKSIQTTEALLALDCCALNRVEPLGGADSVHLINGFTSNVAGTWKDGVYIPPDLRVVIEIDPAKVTPGSSLLTPHPLEQLEEVIEAGEAVEQLERQLSGEVKTPMSGYVVSQEEMQEAVIVSLRPDQAYEIAAGVSQMIPYAQDLSRWIGRHIIIHAAPVEGELLDTSNKGMRDMKVSPEDAPLNHVLGYAILADVKLYTAETWDEDYRNEVHYYPVSLPQIAVASETGKVYGIMVRRPMLLGDRVELKANVLHEFWEPNSPSYTYAIRQTFEEGRGAVDIEKEVDLTSAE